MGRTSDARERLIAVAMRLWHEHAYRTVGVEALCQAAGVHKGSFYHFFPSKSDLAVAALRRCWDEFRREILEPSGEAATPEERLARLFEGIYQQQQRVWLETGRVCGCWFGNLGSEVGLEDELVRRAVAGILGEFSEWLSVVLRPSNSQGRQASGGHDGLVQAILAYWEGVLLQARIANDPSVIRRLAPRGLSWLEPGISSQPSPPADPEPPPEPVKSNLASLDFLD